MRDIREIQKKVESIDLGSILYTLTKRPDWTLWNIDKAKAVEILYRHFLTLVVAYPDKNIVPTQDIDTFWHTHILDTEKYMDDCEKSFGYYIHHFPYFGLRGKEDEQMAADSFSETSELFKKHFGVPLLEESDRCSSHCRSACGPHIVHIANVNTRPSL